MRLSAQRRGKPAHRSLRSRFRQLQREEENGRVRDICRIRRGEATPDQVQRENSPFTQEEMRTFRFHTQDAHNYPITTPHDFKDFLAVTDRNGDPAIIVGGHAVSLWAMYYLDEEPDLKKMAPFTSKDMDFVGDRTTAMQLSWMVREPAEPAPSREHTPVTYRIKLLFPDLSRRNSTLEVLSHWVGVSNEELRRNAMIIQSAQLGVRARLPSPFICLKAKASALMRLKQDKRQDLRQVRILILCCRAHLRHVIRQAENGQITEGAALECFETVFDWTRCRTAQHAAAKNRLNWRGTFPMRELERTCVPSLISFFRASFCQRAG
jgi:hypothetical protein